MTRHQRKKLAHAVDLRVHANPWWLASVILPLVALAVLHEVGPPAGAAVGGVLAMSVVLAIQSDANHRRRVDLACERMFEALGETPFDVHGWRDYLVADLPWITVDLDQPIVDARLAAATRGFDARVVVEKLTDRRFRFYLPPRGLVVKDAIGAVVDAVRWGDPRLARRMFDELLAPLHVECGIARVEMGGEVER